MKEQLTLFDLLAFQTPIKPVGDPAWDEIDTSTSPYPGSCVGGQVASDTQKNAPQHDKVTHWVEKYWVERSSNKYWYYRYCYMIGRKIYRHYLGSERSQLAQSRKSQVEAAIADGKSPVEIEKLIRSWR